ncbi:unnamed protein product [Protopolystoma xenopodis]|uniref:Ig-like domain-containing protein n=1 Tax=Protopolystoma xenopodis TaxID=117903 RepID=A0A3S5CJI0_9PLAT|nr:unnamed protein product [Protopolystoma xenopodis]
MPIFTCHNVGTNCHFLPPPDPPTVRVLSYPSEPMIGQTVTLTCLTTGGSPSTGLAYIWRFLKVPLDQPKTDPASLAVSTSPASPRVEMTHVTTASNLLPSADPKVKVPMKVAVVKTTTTQPKLTSSRPATVSWANWPSLSDMSYLSDRRNGAAELNVTGALMFLNEAGMTAAAEEVEMGVRLGQAGWYACEVTGPGGHAYAMHPMRIRFS